MLPRIRSESRLWPVEPLDAPRVSMARDALVRLPPLTAAKRRHVRTSSTEYDFVALGTWTHPHSRESDLVAINARPNWKYKAVGRWR